MNTASVGRPIGCLKAALRRTRFQRAYATATPSATTNTTGSQIPPPATIAWTRKGFGGRQRKDLEKLKKFQVYPSVPSVRATHPNPMPALRQEQIAKLDPTGARTRMFSKEHADSAKVGDVLMVTTKQGEPFAGAFIQIRRRGVDTAIQLRGQLMKTGVEMWYKIYAPTVTAIDIIWRRPKRARRARLTYMRKPQHDMGSVDNHVFAWKKERYALRSKEKSRTQKK